MSAEKNELQHTGPEYPIVLYGKQITEATIENILAATADFAELHNLRSENVVSLLLRLNKSGQVEPYLLIELKVIDRNLMLSHQEFWDLNQQFHEKIGELQHALCFVTTLTFSTSYSNKTHIYSDIKPRDILLRITLYLKKTLRISKAHEYLMLVRNFQERVYYNLYNKVWPDENNTTKRCAATTINYCVAFEKNKGIRRRAILVVDMRLEENVDSEFEANHAQKWLSWLGMEARKIENAEFLNKYTNHFSTAIRYSESKVSFTR